MATERRRVLYLDASAIVKLVVRERETEALLDHLAGAEVIASEVASIEVPRAALLKTGARETIGHAEALVRRFFLVPLDEELSSRAARVQPPELRSLDAVHLASALRVRDQIEAVVVYDRRLAEAARAVGLPVTAPA